MAQTKIVCTIGPSSSSPKIIEELIQNGMSVARLNFSHGTHEEHLEKILTIRSVAKKLGSQVAILQDLCGPKIRVGIIPNNNLELKNNEIVVLSPKPLKNGQYKHIPLDYPTLAKNVKKSDPILLADGTMELSVLETKNEAIICKVINGGILSSKKGINLPSSILKIKALTNKDIDDLEFGIKHSVDFIALSFVKTKEDILDAKKILKKHKKETPIIAKIEKHEALDNIDEILNVANGIMIARGDLGVEIPIEQVPIIQKNLIRQANKMGKPVIVATQMLRSMVDSPMPTRAEATDVANAVLDGTDAVMLSEETANGNYPIKAISYMYKIIQNTEKENYPHRKYIETMPKETLEENIAHSTCTVSNNLNAKYIIAITSSGTTGFLMSKFKPKARIIALSPNDRALKTLCLYWGCYPYFIKPEMNIDLQVKNIKAELIAKKILEKGDLVIFSAGSPLWQKGTTNTIKAIYV